jgi:hypothetical protein
MLRFVFDLLANQYVFAAATTPASPDSQRNPQSGVLVAIFFAAGFSGQIC